MTRSGIGRCVLAAPFLAMKGISGDRTLALARVSDMTKV